MDYGKVDSNMFYDARNQKALKTLAPHTRKVANQWYAYCVKNGIDILITEGRRSVAVQQANVAKGVSKTLRSYHLVGQALDFVPVINSRGTISYSHYTKEPFKSAINYAKSLGFEWGGEWKSFQDSPHLQYKYKGYGTDQTILEKITKQVKAVPKDLIPYPGSLIRKGSRGKDVERIQRALKLDVDGIYGRGTEIAVMEYQKRKKLTSDGIVGQSTWSMLF